MMLVVAKFNTTHIVDIWAMGCARSEKRRGVAACPVTHPDSSCQSDTECEKKKGVVTISVFPFVPVLSHLCYR